MIMRILFVITTSDFGGTETFLRILSTHLDRNEFEPIACTLCPPGAAALEMRQSGVEVVTLGMAAGARLRELLSGWRRLAKLIDETGTDLVHSLLYRANVLAPLASRFSRRRPPVVAGQRSLTPMTGRKAARAARFTRRLCSRIVVPSRAVSSMLIDDERVDPGRVEVIPNGVDTERFTVADRRQQRRELDLPVDAPLIGAVGRLSPEKGMAYLVEAFAGLGGNGRSPYLVIAGDGPERRRLEQQVEALGIAEQVRLLGRRSDLEKLYPALDLFVLPSLEEGSPNALIEALACGCCCIATRVGGSPEVLNDGEFGDLVEPASAEQLRHAMQALLHDVDRRRSLEAAARQHVTAHFSVSSMVAAYGDLYRQLAANGSAGRSS